MSYNKFRSLRVGAFLHPKGALQVHQTFPQGLICAPANSAARPVKKFAVGQNPTRTRREMGYLPRLMTKQLIAALALATSVIAYRLLPIFTDPSVAESLANISPLLALALCGGMMMPRRLAAGVTFGVFAISDVALNLFYEAPIFNRHSGILLLAFAIVFGAGWLLRGRASLKVALLGGLGGTLLFYLLTNTAATFYNPAYAKSAAGWWQAMTVGVPGLPPTWMFGLRSLTGNLFFCAAFYLALRPVCATAPERAAAPAV